jgi:hypothetical protein
MEADSSGAYDKSRMLTANAAGACERCFGTGTDSAPEGAMPCDHRPLTAEEKAERDELRDEKLSWLREQMKEVMRPKPPSRPATPQPPKGVWLKCSKCPRKVNVLHYEPGQVCKELLNRGVHDGDLKFCDGTFEVGVR